MALYGLSGPDVVSTLRNRIPNPCAQSSVENGNTAGSTTGYYIAEGWRQVFVTSAGVISGQRIQSATLAGALDRARVSVTTADTALAAGESLSIVIDIEGPEIADAQFGTSAAKDLAVRFMAKLPAGTYAVALRNAALNRSYIREITAVAGVDTVYEVTFPGDTAGTWPTGEALGMSLTITLASGSTLQTTKDAWQAGNYLGTSSVSNGLGAVQSFDLGDVGLRVDRDGIGTYGQFEIPNYSQNELACFRYCHTNPGLMGSMNPGNTIASFGPGFKVPMMKTPTVSIKTASSTIIIPATATYNISSINAASNDRIQLVPSTLHGANVGVSLVADALIYKARMT